MKIQSAVSDKSHSLWNEDSLQLNFYKFFEQHPIYSTAFFKNGDKGEFVFYRDRKTYVSSIRFGRSLSDSVYQWKRFSRPGEIMNQWNEVLSNDLVNQDWYEGSHTYIGKEQIYWEGQYQSVFVKEPVFTGAIAWMPKEGNQHSALAFEVPAKHLVKAMRKYNWYHERRLFILSDDGDFVNIPASSKDSIVFSRNDKSDTISKDEVLARIKSDLSLFQSDSAQTFTFFLNEEPWWVHIDQVKIHERTIQYGIALREGELLLGKLRKNQFLLFLLLAFLILGTISFYVWKKKNPGSSEKIGKKGSSDVTETDLPELIEKGEGNKLEFKSSLRWDYQQEKVNPRLEEVVFKTIAAFSNGEGGMLIIGVDDESQILGIEKDFKTLKRFGPDFFEIHLRNLLNTHFGISFSTNQLIINFAQVMGSYVCTIEIEKSSEPVYLAVTDKNGNKAEKFYVRSGNSSQEIKSLKEISTYITQRFNK
ncbi:MAG: ATP-binding protein, partial [Bacteroidota bacterium]|nr:ATP-binding protein [Bacteroidota bacterium]